MKKGIIFLFCLFLTGALGLSGCSGPTLQTRTVNGLSIRVPSDYSPFKDAGGYLLGEGPNGSISISPPTEMDMAATDWTEEALIALYSESYSNVKFRSFSNNNKIQGGMAVYGDFTATTSDNKDVDVRVAILHTDDGKLYANYILFLQGANCSTAKYADEILKSIQVAG